MTARGGDSGGLVSLVGGAVLTTGSSAAWSVGSLVLLRTACTARRNPPSCGSRASNRDMLRGGKETRIL
jgi:hypothetical protein